MFISNRSIKSVFSIIFNYLIGNDIHLCLIPLRFLYIQNEVETFFGAGHWENNRFITVWSWTMKTIFQTSFTELNWTLHQLSFVFFFSLNSVICLRVSDTFILSNVILDSMNLIFQSMSIYSAMTECDEESEFWHFTCLLTFLLLLLFHYLSPQRLWDICK